MRNDFYEDGNVRHLIATDMVADNTKQVLLERMEKPAAKPARFFEDEDFTTLEAVCSLLLPQQDRLQPIDLPGLLEDQLIAESGNGWRYATMPDDGEAMKLGIKGINETASSVYQQAFYQITTDQQSAVLTSVQAGSVRGENWKQLSPQLFFEELLSRLVEIYYSHPIAKDEIGDNSFADKQGWAHVGLNEVTDFETTVKRTDS